MRNKKAKEIRRAIKLGWQGTMETNYIDKSRGHKYVPLSRGNGYVDVVQRELDPLCFRKLYKTVKKNMKRTTQGEL